MEKNKKTNSRTKMMNAKTCLKQRKYYKKTKSVLNNTFKEFENLYNEELGGWLQERPLDFGSIFYSIHFFLWEYFKIRKIILRKTEKYV